MVKSHMFKEKTVSEWQVLCKWESGIQASECVNQPVNLQDDRNSFPFAPAWRVGSVVVFQHLPNTQWQKYNDFTELLYYYYYIH